MTDLAGARCFLKVFVRNYCKERTNHFPRQVFSAIQPTGEVHLGNYLGAIKKWTELQKTEENLIFCIADLHSISLPQNPSILNQNILHMAATFLATGIDVGKSIFYQQSDVHQHSELCWILGTLCTMARLSRLPQFREKSAPMKEVPVGLFLYPVLQAADIALYKATHVPVGKDQGSHLELANELTKSFNRNFGLLFPYAKSLIDDHAGNIKSLKEPGKKMSKSGKPKSTINLTDSPDTIKTNCMKAVTDCISRVTYDPTNRPGVSNLLLIHSQLTGKSIDTICRESENLNTGQYKLVLADVIIETLKPIREEIHRYLRSEDYLESILRSGAEKASEKAEVTMREVREKTGIKAGIRNRTKDTLLKVNSNTN